MQYKWLNDNNNNKIIIFFNGWGMDETIINHLGVEDYDILMFYDYNSLNTDFNFSILEKYSEKHLIAWSMGVMVGSLFPIEYNSKIAINGTLKPIDVKYGINPKIYDLTINGFNEESCKKFIRNMFEAEVNLTINRNFENQKTELVAIKNYSAKNDFEYNKIFISDNDKIFPTKCQIAFWGIEPNLKNGHCPFFSFKKWSELL